MLQNIIPFSKHINIKCYIILFFFLNIKFLSIINILKKKKQKKTKKTKKTYYMKNDQ